MTAAPSASTLAQPAVMATRPASEALRHMETSGFPFFLQVNSMQVTVATAGAIVVVPKMRAISPTSAAAAPLKPYHANHRMKTPKAPRVTECPGIAFEVMLPSGFFVYLPMRGPRITAPTSAERPPVMWITQDPAKSMKLSLLSQPPPQTQPASIG